MTIEHLPYITIEAVKWQLVRDGNPFGTIQHADSVDEAMAKARALVNSYAAVHPGTKASWEMRWR